MGRARVPRKKKGRRDRMGVVWDRDKGWCGTGTNTNWLPRGKCAGSGAGLAVKVLEKRGKGTGKQGRGRCLQGGTATCWPGKGGTGVLAGGGAGAFVGWERVVSCNLGHAAGHAAIKWAGKRK